MFPLLADFEKPLRVIRDDAVRTMLDAPAHVIVIIHRPEEERAASSFGVADEPRSTRAKEGQYEHVE